VTLVPDSGGDEPDFLLAISGFCSTFRALI